jgi:hypothetical protein
MTVATKALQVRRVTLGTALLDRDDVVNHGCHDNISTRLTQWLACELPSRDVLPIGRAVEPGRSVVHGAVEYRYQPLV